MGCDSSVWRKLTDCTGRKASAAICQIVSYFQGGFFYHLSVLFFSPPPLLHPVGGSLASESQRVHCYARRRGKPLKSKSGNQQWCDSVGRIRPRYFEDPVEDAGRLRPGTTRSAAANLGARRLTEAVAATCGRGDAEFQPRPSRSARLRPIFPHLGYICTS